MNENQTKLGEGERSSSGTEKIDSYTTKNLPEVASSALVRQELDVIDCVIPELKSLYDMEEDERQKIISSILPKLRGCELSRESLAKHLDHI